MNNKELHKCYLRWRNNYSALLSSNTKNKPLPFISVVITAYNKLSYLKNTLASFNNQTYPKNLYEVIVVDDGSSDDTRKYVKSLRKSFCVPLKYFWQPDKGYRLSKARNEGIKIARGPIIIINDADIIVSSDYLSKHSRYYKLFDKIAVLPIRKRIDSKEITPEIVTSNFEKVEQLAEQESPITRLKEDWRLKVYSRTDFLEKDD